MTSIYAASSVSCWVPIKKKITPDDFQLLLKKYTLELVEKGSHGIGKRKVSGVCGTSDCEQEYTKEFRQILKNGPFCKTCITAPLYITRAEIGKKKQEERIEKEKTTGTFKCPKCKKDKPISENTRLHQKKRLCILCRKQKNDGNVKKFLSYLLKHCQYRTTERNRNGRNHTIDIDYDYILNIWENQNGKCAISGIPMNLKSTTDWQCSIDRINNKNGYVKGNVRLVCLEFQHHLFQWSKELWIDFVKKHKGSINKDIDKEEIDFIMNYVEQSKQFRSVKIRNVPIKKGDIKQDDKSEYNKQRMMTLNGRLRNCFASAKHSTKQRRKKKTATKRQNLNFDITLEELFRIYQDQNGRCYYSGIVMEFEGPFLVSIERKNPFKGYENENVVLVCNAFNTSDRIVYSHDMRNGSSGWSKNKILEASSYIDQNLNISPIQRTFFDVYKSLTPIITRNLTELSIDAIINDFSKNANTWCNKKGHKTSQGVDMKYFIQNLRRGGILLTYEQRQKLLNTDPTFFDKKRQLCILKLSMKQKINRLVEYWKQHSKWPEQKYVMDDGFRLGLFKQNTRRNPPSSMDENDKKSILNCDFNFFK